MSDLDDAETQVTAWLQPLPDESAPCGPDLEYDNDFLALTQAAAGKRESQFGPAEAPEWRSVVERCESLFERTRDLRVAILWLRASLHLKGYAFLPAGLRLLCGLMASHWDQLHPLPDPEDGDFYARVNALTLLRESAGLIGDLRETRIVSDRAIGEISGRAVELVLGLGQAVGDEVVLGKDSLVQMVAVAADKSPQLRNQFGEALAMTRQLMKLVDEKLGSDLAPDLRPLYAMVNGINSLLPVVVEAGADSADGGAGGDVGGRARQSLSGAVNSRAEAVRAIDLICEYLERTEPSNPAPLFLRRAKQLINHNFLQLMKVLAPDSLAEVARVVGIDPDAVEDPGGS